MMRQTKRATQEPTTGARNCLRTCHNTRGCDRCGAAPAVVHVPTRAPGAFCERCCPCCGALSGAGD